MGNRRARSEGNRLPALRVAVVGVLAALVLAVPAPAGAAGRRAAISSHCSLATAAAVVRSIQPFSNDPPVEEVLCGAFAGAHSNAMLTSLATPGCGGSIGWYVFRRTATAWETVHTSTHGAFFAKLPGGRFRETWNILRGHDAHCFPTGGSQSRTWHWNGHRLVHTPFVRTGAMFVSPTRNLWCVIEIGKVICESAKAPHAARLTTQGRLTTCQTRSCGGLGSQPTNAKVLAYGRSITAGPFRCRSAPEGATCVLRRTGTGFLINHTGVTSVG